MQKEMLLVAFTWIVVIGGWVFAESTLRDTTNAAYAMPVDASAATCNETAPVADDPCTSTPCGRYCCEKGERPSGCTCKTIKRRVKCNEDDKSENCWEEDTYPECSCS